MALTPIYRCGAAVSETLITDLKYLWGQVRTNDNVCHFREAHTTVGYQVTTGKTLYLVRMRAFAEGSLDGAAQMWIKFGYADNDVGFDTATARTAPVMSLGLDDTNKNGINLVAAGNVLGQPWGEDDSFPWKLAIADKFPFLRVHGTSSSTIDFYAWAIEL